MNLKYGLGFILVLAILLAASSLFFRNRSEPEPVDPLEFAAAERAELDTKIKAQEAESIATERGINEQMLDGEINATGSDDVIEEPESNLEIVFMNLTQEMARRGYARGLSECIESQFRENQGIENPKDLDAMLQICDSQFKVEPPQSQQLREVVLQAIAKAQNRPEETDKTSVQ